MSSKSIQKKENGLPEESEEIEHINYSLLIIPFDRITSLKKPSYIYNGSETIPFKERHPLYQAILWNEFTNKIKDH